MKIRLLSTVAMVGFLAGLGSVKAADVIEEPAPAPAPVYEQPLSTAGWYLRADVGYVFKSHNSGDWDFYNQFPGVEGIDDTHHYDKIDIGENASFDIGVGYRFNEFLRGDATLDYFRTDVSGGTECPFQIKNDALHGQSGPSLDCHYDIASEADVYTTMANAYIDLPFFGTSVVPYLGAGIGAAYVDYDDLKLEEKCPACNEPNYAAFKSTNEGNESWRFASALMAGATVDLTGSLKLDAGYKYTRIEDGDAFDYDAADKSFGANGTQIRDHGFDIHTVRAGLRYEFGGGSGYGEASEPAPVYK